MVASARNWPRIAERGAPIALRMPISRIRSVTVTSMMLVTPIPPTSSEIAATAPSSTVNVWVADVRVARSCSEFWIWKSGLPPSRTPWRASRIAVISDWARETDSAVVACTTIWLRLP